MKTLFHSEPIYHGRRIIIDAADLRPACPYIEVMAMYPNGTEIESTTTHNEQDAEAIYNLYCGLVSGNYPSGTYTSADWMNDRSFNAKPGQAITEDIYNEMLNALPPLPLPHDLKRAGFKGFCMGEPHSHTAAGPQYMAFVRRGLRYYYYGLVTA